MARAQQPACFAAESVPQTLAAKEVVSPLAMAVT
jgi:hypothetical protein